MKDGLVNYPYYSTVKLLVDVGNFRQLPNYLPKLRASLAHMVPCIDEIRRKLPEDGIVRQMLVEHQAARHLYARGVKLLKQFHPREPSIMRRNAEKDPSYCPYCMRCDGLVRMKKVEPFLWACSCGAIHDERHYRGYHITYDPPPIPDRRHDFQFAHVDYSGPGDPRCGTAATHADCIQLIDELESELVGT